MPKKLTTLSSSLTIIAVLIFSALMATARQTDTKRVVKKDLPQKPVAEISKPSTTTKDQVALYKDQFKELMKIRGINKEEEYYKEFERIAGDITDYKSVFKFIKRYYALSSETAIIYYFFANDRLTTVFFDPAASDPIVETIAINKRVLMDIPVSLNQAILYNKSSKPVSRGIELIGNTVHNLDSVVKIATKLLIPKAFNDSYKNLIIIPALNIGTLPFHVLKPYADGSYLIDKCSFSVAPGLIDFIGMSDRLCRTLGQDRKLGQTEFNWNLENPLFVRNPVYPTKGSIKFEDLPGAKAEIDSVKQYATNYTLLDGPKATKEQVLKYIRGADLAYFATHGIADDADPLQKSFLVLSGEEDPYLTAKDILDLRLTTKDSAGKRKFPEMIILSACETGLGRAVEAGIIGLARSFIVAGGNQVIMSLWNVDDRATAYLMSRFMYYLTLDTTKYIPAAPMRKAILDTKIKYPDPSKWASFSVFGVSY